MKPKPLRERKAWKALEDHHRNSSAVHLRGLFADDPGRGERLHRLGRRSLPRLLQEPHHRRNLEPPHNLAEESGLRERIDAMFRGEKINITEDRAVLHVALRAPKGRIDSGRRRRCRAPGTRRTRSDAEFRRRIRSGDWKGHTGRAIRNVVNIGIGGSDLGPVMAYEALRHYSERAL